MGREERRETTETPKGTPRSGIACGSHEPRGFFVSAYANAPCPNMGREERRETTETPKGPPRSGIACGSHEPRGLFVSAYANAPCPNMGRGRWRRRRDSNPRGLAPKRFSRPPRYDRFDTPAFPLYYIFPPPFCQTFFAFSPFFLRNPLDFICIMCYNTDDTKIL